jgi:hypothetical protein
MLRGIINLFLVLNQTRLWLPDGYGQQEGLADRFFVTRSAMV